MFFFLKLTLFLSTILITRIIGDDSSLNSRKENLYVRKSTYKGESFPIKYLITETSAPTASDLEYYIHSLQRTVNYFHDEIVSSNDTEINKTFGIFFMKSVLKRIVRDHRDKLSELHYNVIKDLIRKGEEIVSVYVSMIKYPFVDSVMEYRVAGLLQDDTAQVFSIGDFKKDRMKKWILNNIPMHSYVERMDNLTLAKEKYAEITEAMDSFFVSISESDECISRIIFNQEPINLSVLRPCRPDDYCREVLLSSPSAAYALSHRLLNILLRHSRRCYLQTEKEDYELMDILCAFMYREAVYIARRGYFARDLFLEHVALCGLLGYEEFFRHQWFRKAASWIDNQGCINESHNFLINRTRNVIEKENHVGKHRKWRKKLKFSLIEECHSHPMALLVIVMAHAIRHTLNFMNE